MPTDRNPRRLDRSQLPQEFTPETVRALGMRTARLLARPGNGVLTPAEQQAFDAALREVMAASAGRFGRSFGGGRPGSARDLDPNLQRSYQRTQRRLDAQAAQLRQAFPQLADAWDLDAGDAPPEVGSAAAPDHPTDPDEPTGPAPLDEPGIDEHTDASGDVSIGAFEAEVAQTSEMMEVLEQIAGLQQQQLDDQRARVLSETRSVFFALAVSVAVIVAGVAPLVEASPHDRRLILLWTAGLLAVAGGVYAAVRAWQARAERAEATGP